MFMKVSHDKDCLVGLSLKYRTLAGPVSLAHTVELFRLTHVLSGIRPTINIIPDKEPK